ncbi:MAG: ABC transporter ATP-binding protein [Candidatus Bipolaricaulaceae bacterium]
MISCLLRLAEVSKTYRMGAVDVHALRGVSLCVERGQLLGIMGPSGSGKSTLLHIAGLLDVPTSGQVYWEGDEVTSLRAGRLAELRGRKIGFVFQTFNLAPTLTALENVELPLVFQGVPPRARRRRARELLGQLGLTDRAGHRPTQLSGGQQQRTSLARALASDPDLILADEPTGNLDTQAGREILALLSGLQARGRTVVVVTHDPDAAAVAQRILRMRDGRILNGSSQ